MGCFPANLTNQPNGLVVNINNTTNKRRVIQENNTDIRKNYEYISVLGNGAFGKVKLYRDRNYKDLLFAIKTLKKEGVSKDQFDLLKNEVRILSCLDHPNIVKYFGTFEDEYFIHIQMEYLKGDDLTKIISIKKYTKFEEKNMREIIFQLLKALSFIHFKDIKHRDIKPDNILFADKYDYSTLKLIDFGLATTSKHDNKSVGTPYFMSPEMIDGKATTKSDVWSVGVITYLMLTDKYPFNPEDDKTLFEVIKTKDWDRATLDEESKDKDFSTESYNFIEACLSKDLDNRMSSEQCLRHEWFTKYNLYLQNIIDKEYLKKVKQTLINFSSKTPLQKEIYYFLAKITKESEINLLKKLFIDLDNHNIGYLTKEEISNGFYNLGVTIEPNEMSIIWEGLDFHRDEVVNYSEFIAATISSFDYSKEDKLMSVFNLMKDADKTKIFITFDTVRKAAEAQILKINEQAIKKCFDKYDKKEIKYEEFKKLIIENDYKSKISKEG